MTRREPDLTPLLPDLSGREALFLARLLTRLADEIWRTYHVDIGLVLREDLGSLGESWDAYGHEDDDLPF